MKKNLVFLLCTLFLASCVKQEQSTGKNDSAKTQEGQVPDKSKYPTVNEADLKGVVRTRFDSPNPTAAQLARRTKNNKAIREMGLPVLESLPVVEDEKTAKLRTPEEIAKRCLATTICAIKGETRDQMFVDSLIKDYSATAYFSPAEQKFIKDLNPPQQNVIDFAWRYECVHVFLWAMGTRDSLSPPNEICSVSDDMKLLKKTAPAKFVTESKRRTSPRDPGHGRLLLSPSLGRDRPADQGQEIRKAGRGSDSRATSCSQLVDRLFESRMGRCYDRYVRSPSTGKKPGSDRWTAGL